MPHDRSALVAAAPIRNPGGRVEWSGSRPPSSAARAIPRRVVAEAGDPTGLQGRCRHLGRRACSHDQRTRQPGTLRCKLGPCPWTVHPAGTRCRTTRVSGCTGMGSVGSVPRSGVRASGASVRRPEAPQPWKRLLGLWVLLSVVGVIAGVASWHPGSQDSHGCPQDSAVMPATVVLWLVGVVIAVLGVLVERSVGSPVPRHGTASSAAVVRRAVRPRRSCAAVVRVRHGLQHVLEPVSPN